MDHLVRPTSAVYKAKGNLEKLIFAQLADSETEKPKAELLHLWSVCIRKTVRKGMPL